jgi:hypothetical protein
VSRAFIKEDADDATPRPKFDLPNKQDPNYPRAAARALLEGARVGDTFSAEEATGFRWGDPKLVAFVEEALEEADRLGDDRLAQVAERYLRHASKGPADS